MSTATPALAASPVTGPVVPGPAAGAPADPLAGLHDWHLPDPVSWWPPAPGWWLLAALALGALGLGVLRRQAHRRRDAAARAALVQLRSLRARLVGAGTGADGPVAPEDFAAAVSVLLRRLALTRFPRTRVAGLCGDAWLAFLDGTGGGGDFAQGAGRLLTELPYRAPGRVAPAEALALADLAERWVRARPSGPARDTRAPAGPPRAPLTAPAAPGSPAAAHRPLP